MKNTEFYSNGKFLLTGEYAIIDGALSLAIPLKFGQKLIINESNSDFLSFKTYQNELLIYNQTFINDNCSIATSNPTKNNPSDDFITKILNIIFKMKPELFTNSLEFISELNFDINWGLGSSSSLISNFSQWSKIDKFELFKEISNGSGYDIFAAQSDTPITFQLVDGIPQIKKVGLNEDILSNCFFVYLGKKQNSENEVYNYKKNTSLSSTILNDISELTNKFISISNTEELLDIILHHESIISDILHRPKVKQELFSDFEGEIKSLGAWGGDFIMVSSFNDSEYIINYFKSKAYTTLFKWDDIVLKKIPALS